MEQEQNHEVEKNKRSGVWLIFLAVVITAVVVGGGVYWWQSSKIIEEEITEQENIFSSNSGRVIVGTASGKVKECIEQWNEYYDTNKAEFKYVLKDVTVNYSPKLDSCLSVYKRCDRDNIEMCFNRIDASAEEYDGCNFSGDDPSDEEIFAYFNYLITGEPTWQGIFYYISRMKSECNISL